MQLFDLRIERGFENADRLARHRTQPGDAVEHGSVHVLGQRGERLGSDFAVELQQQHGNRLRMLVGQDFADDLRIQPAQ